ncbi:hypothetical protein [Mesorhizobium temperatum]|uniref:hypothetical protein n=1 Tax=Mesorhizobium temperatum TaxID=241416 RepID=UPI001FD8CB7A|nr:hypothetical protein [Mesorhizobium temperatum]
MRIEFVLFAVAALATSSAQAGSQSSNTSSNSSSNNGVVRERIVETYCEDGYCERYVKRRVFVEDWNSDHDREWDRGRYEDDDDDD